MWDFLTRLQQQPKEKSCLSALTLTFLETQLWIQSEPQPGPSQIWGGCGLRSRSLIQAALPFTGKTVNPQGLGLRRGACLPDLAGSKKGLT